MTTTTVLGLETTTMASGLGQPLTSLELGQPPQSSDKSTTAGLGTKATMAAPTQWRSEGHHATGATHKEVPIGCPFLVCISYTSGTMASADVTWLIIRNNSSTLLKRSRQNMSLEPNNLKSKNSFRYNGLIHRKTVGIEPAKDGKGVVLVTKKSTGLRKPSKHLTKVELKKDPRLTIATIPTH
ncbi:60S ribosomal protein L28 [Bulinus truncatus]|nr:60S ribosomal protein L28 [Bulinus truncatus]